MRGEGIAFSVSSRGEKELPVGDSSLAGDESCKRSVSPREEKESPAGDSSPAGNESCGRPVGNGRCGELHVKLIMLILQEDMLTFTDDISKHTDRYVDQHRMT
ncbi:hypothetical protein BHE74_00025815 [Ensete ventricosum]|nr:hypothetical protein BHE74_00025815 [Ensete ventricosum]